MGRLPAVWMRETQVGACVGAFLEGRMSQGPPASRAQVPMRETR